jgi:hypothetical protein
VGGDQNLLSTNFEFIQQLIAMNPRHHHFTSLSVRNLFHGGARATGIDLQVATSSRSHPNLVHRATFVSHSNPESSSFFIASQLDQNARLLQIEQHLEHFLRIYSNDRVRLDRVVLFDHQSTVTEAQSQLLRHFGRKQSQLSFFGNTTRLDAGTYSNVHTFQFHSLQNHDLIGRSMRQLLIRQWSAPFLN